LPIREGGQVLGYNLAIGSPRTTSPTQIFDQGTQNDDRGSPSCSQTSTKPGGCGRGRALSRPLRSPGLRAARSGGAEKSRDRHLLADQPPRPLLDSRDRPVVPTWLAMARRAVRRLSAGPSGSPPPSPRGRRCSRRWADPRAAGRFPTRGGRLNGCGVVPRRGGCRRAVWARWTLTKLDEASRQAILALRVGAIETGRCRGRRLAGVGGRPAGRSTAGVGPAMTSPEPLAHLFSREEPALVETPRPPFLDAGGDVQGRRAGGALNSIAAALYYRLRAHRAADRTETWVAATTRLPRSPSPSALNRCSWTSRYERPLAWASGSGRTVKLCRTRSFSFTASPATRDLEPEILALGPSARRAAAVDPCGKAQRLRTGR